MGLPKKRPYVVLVDDCPDESMLAARILRDHPSNIELVELKDGLEAIDKLTAKDAKRPDLVLIDNKMPILKGVDVIRTLNEDERLWSTPMVLVSSRLTKQLVNDAYKAGARSCVEKEPDIIKWNRQMRGVLSYWLEVNKIDPDD